MSFKQPIYTHHPCRECDPSDSCLNCAFGALKAAMAGMSVNRLRALVAAEQDGRLVVLPCDKGACLWSIDEGYLTPFRVDFFDNEFMYSHYKDTWGRGYFFEEHKISAIGKTVFLTREEAVAAM